MNGLMMDFQLTLPTILKRAETYFPHQEIVTRMPDRSFHTYSFADFGKRARQLAVALQGPRPRAGRPGRHALLEPLPAPRGVSRDPVRRLRPPHAQPAASPERPRLHRDARERQGRDRRPQPAPALGAVRGQDARSSTSSSSRTPTRSCSPGPTRTPTRIRGSTRTPPRPCATRAAPPGCRRASSTRTARPSCTRSARRSRRRSAST